MLFTKPANQPTKIPAGIETKAEKELDGNRAGKSQAYEDTEPLGAKRKAEGYGYEENNERIMQEGWQYDNDDPEMNGGSPGDNINEIRV